MQIKDNTITWLHLSDLHYCEPRDGWDAESVLEALAEDLEKMENRHGLSPDLVFFTGDIAFGNMKKEKGWNLKDQYAGAAKFLDSVRKAFSKEIPKTNVFLVPGNHDVNRKSVTKSQISYLDRVEDEAEITAMIRDGELEWQDCVRRLAEYKAFLKNRGYGHLLQDPDRLVYGIERKIGNRTVGIGGFNSVWSCCREKEKGQLWMAANWQSRTVLSKIKKADVRIALAHHPDGWFKEPEKQYFRRIQNTFHFFLHGHEHDDWVTPIANHHATISAGACYERSGKRDGYNFVRIDFETDTVEIWPRAYGDKGAGGWTRAQLPGKLDDDGAWRIHEFQWKKSKKPGVRKFISANADAKTGFRAPSKLRESYLRHVMKDAGFLTLAGIDKQAADNDEFTQLDIDAVYTALMTHTLEAENEWLEQRVRMEKENRLSALAVLNREQKLALLGEPGSGKSTFVNFVAWCLAGENLGEPNANLVALQTPLPGDEKDDEKKPQPWQHGALIPVRVVLRDFVAGGWLDGNAEESATSALRGFATRSERSREESGDLPLWGFIESMLKQKGIGEFADDLKTELLNSGGLILLDGLDEVPEAGQRREKVKQAVEDFAATFHPCRFLVTSRTYAYQRQKWQLDDFRVAVLSPFGQAQINRFVELWYQRVAPKRGIPASKAEEQAKDLQHQISKSKQLTELAERPLLLTLMACLHAFYSGKLPEKRVQLYEDTVNLLLEWWDRAKWKENEDGEKTLAEPRISVYLDKGMDAILGLLKRLAFEAHKNQSDLGRVADIPKKRLLDGLLDLTTSDDANPKQLLKYLRERAGILVPRGVDVFTFPHRTFQEYLTACFQTEADYPYDIADLFRQDPDRWREVLLLAGAISARVGDYGVWMLANELCPDTCGDDSKDADLWGALLAGQALVESADVANVRPSNKKTLERVRNSLVCVLQGNRLPALERARAGVALAQIGDPRPEIMTLDAMQFCQVTPGGFVMSEKDDGKELCAIMNYPYWMARFPISNAQFEFFVQAGGYANKDYWEEAVREGMWKAGKVKGRYENEYRERQYNWGTPFILPNHPVVGVMWYEAMAFTRWLTETWHASGVLPRELIVALPSEAEWEKAARGGVEIPETAVVLPVSEIPATPPEMKPKENPNPARRYPYGNEPDPEQMNFKETDINTSSALGCFSSGKSPYGCEEMCGNSFEWTRSIDNAYPYDPDDGREDLTKVTNSTRMRIRGGSFLFDDDWSRCGFRDWHDPSFQHGLDGFRLLLRAPFSSTSGL